MRFHVLIQPRENGDGYQARCVEVLGVSAEGETEEAALANVRERIKTILQVRRREAELTLERIIDVPHRLEPVEVELENP